MVHFDLDSLDIRLGQANKFSAPGGLFEEDLYSCFNVIVQRTRPVSLTVASLNPTGEVAENIGGIAIRSIENIVRSLISTGVLANNAAA